MRAAVDKLARAGAAVLAALLGAALATLLSLCVDNAELIFQAHPVLSCGLVIAGAGAGIMHRISSVPMLWGTPDAIGAAKNDGPMPLSLIPVVFCGTVLTILFGGSVGKVAATLQMGAIAASFAHRKASLPGSRCDVVMCGMVGGLAALFGRPFFAALYVLEIFSFEKTTKRTYVLVALSAAVGKLVSFVTGLGAPDISLAFPAVTPQLLGAVVLVSACAALAGIVMTTLLTTTKRYVLKRPRVGIGTMLVVSVIVPVLVLTVGNTELCGTGLSACLTAFGGQVTTPLFALKLLFTAVLLCAGFKGGAIVPLMSVGALLGCYIGNVLGIEPGFLAAIGLLAMLVACTNATLAAVCLGCEMAGLVGAGWFVLAALVAFCLTMRFSIYGNIRVYRALRSKFRGSSNPS